MSVENGTEVLYTDYFNRVLRVNFDEIEPLNSRVIRRSMRIMRYISMLVAAISAFWIFMDIFVRNRSLNLTKGFTLVMLIVLVVFSVIMFLLSKKKYRRISSKTEQWLIFIFDMLVIVTVLVLRVTKNMTIVENNAVSSYIGVSLSSFYLLLITLTPIPSVVLSVMLFISALVVSVLPMFLPGSEAYSIAQNAVLLVVSVTVYLVIRDDHTHLSNSRMNADELNRQLIISSYVDELSGLLNRRAYDDYLAFIRSKKDIENIGVFMFDVDNFKSYNDTYSHLKGDEVLKGVSRAVANEFADDGIFVFRYGGEEFIVISENPNEDSAKLIAERILNAVRNEAIPRGDVPGFKYVTVSVGYAIEPNTDSIRYDTIVRADNALYEGKKATKNCAVAAE